MVKSIFPILPSPISVSSSTPQTSCSIVPLASSAVTVISFNEIAPNVTVSSSSILTSKSSIPSLVWMAFIIACAIFGLGRAMLIASIFRFTSSPTMVISRKLTRSNVASSPSIRTPTSSALATEIVPSSISAFRSV